MIYMKTKNIFVFLAIFLCLLNAPACTERSERVVYADAAIADSVPEKQLDESFDKLPVETPDVSNETQPITQHGQTKTSLSVPPVMPADGQITFPDEGDNTETEIDDARLEFLTQTLAIEKQRLEELELEHKKLFDEVAALSLNEVKEQPPIASGVGSLESGVRTQDSLTQVPETDFKGLKPEGNVDLLGTADGLYKLSQYEAALQIYQSIDPEKTSEEDNGWILYQTANCCRNLNQFDNALKTYQTLLAKYPNTCPAKEAHWYLEDLNWWKQWYEKAKVTLSAKETTKPQLPLPKAKGE